MQQIISKTPKMSAKVVTFAFLIDIIFIQNHGTSPAFLPIAQLLSSLGTDFFYLAVIAFMLAAWLIVPALIVYFSVAGFSYFILSYPFRKVRWIRVLLQWMQRGRLDIGEVKAFAIHFGEADLLESLRVQQKKSADSLKGTAHSFLNLILFVYLISISNFEHPNFIMLICGKPLPLDGCTKYYLVVFVVLFGFIASQAMNFSLMFKSNLLPKDFPLSNTQMVAFLKFKKDRKKEFEFAEAVERFMRGPTKDK